MRRGTRRRSPTQLGRRHAAHRASGCPFTDAKGLTERQQIARRHRATSRRFRTPTSSTRTCSQAVQGTDGKIYGLPDDVYGVGLHYNRTLFEQAGLDPDRPPTTWDEVRAVRRSQIAREDRPGRLRPDEPEQHRRLDADHAHLRPRRPDGVRATVTRHAVNNDATEAGPRSCSTTCGGRTTRWAATPATSGATINQAFAAGKIGMYMSRLGRLQRAGHHEQINPDDYGLAALPLSDSADAGILGGGSLAAVSAKATAPRRPRRSSGSTTTTCRSSTDEDAAVLDAKTLPRPTSRSARRRCRSSTRPPCDECRRWIKPYINVPRTRCRRSPTGSSTSSWSPSRTSMTQDALRALDSVVQKVLTDEGRGHRRAAGQHANDQAQQLLDQS